MTKKIKNDEAKQRMRAYLKDRGISLSDAEAICSYKRGYLSAGGVVGSDKLTAFIEAYPDCDLYYIVTGNRHGDPRIDRAHSLITECSALVDSEQKKLKALEKLVTNMVTKI